MHKVSPNEQTHHGRLANADAASAPAALPSKSPIDRPRLYLKSISFSDGQTLELEDDEIVVFVGPNNAGKSAALRELEAWIGQSTPQKVVTSAAFRKYGNAEALLGWLEANSLRKGDPGQHSFVGMGYSIHHTHVGFLDSETNRAPVSKFFSSRLSTETRLTDSNPAGPVALYIEPPTHPIHLLLTDEKLAEKVSGFFSRAFKSDLIVLRAGGSAFPLLVGQKPDKQLGEDDFSKRFVDALILATEPLQSQGDGMRSFASVLLHVLVADNHSVQFLDEPEAFLHPPQARLLGEFIARERRAKSQLFIATHSPGILEGLMAGNLRKVRIVRIQRDGKVNRIRELSKEKSVAIAGDPLTRYSGVFSGIFHQRVIIAESDSDCLFYNSILNTKKVSGDEYPDVLFIHAGGKHRMHHLAGTLKSLDVPVSVIADIDLLNEESVVRELFEVLGGNWTDIENHWTALKTSVESLRPPLNAIQVKGQIEKELDGIDGTGSFPKKAEQAIKYIFKALSPWHSVKKAGRSAFGRGSPINHFDELIKKCAERGLWIVPVGELEGFCRTIEARHGPDFVQTVLTHRDLENDPDLEEARSFVAKIWNS
jgi:ABC-type cobalamin/Fe3+-siderophores transport system ATPase subunit